MKLGWCTAVCVRAGGQSAEHVHVDGDGAQRQGHRAAAAQEGRPGQADGARRHRRQAAAGDRPEADRVRAGHRRLRAPARPRPRHHEAAGRRRGGEEGRRCRGQGHTDRLRPPRTTRRATRLLHTDRKLDKRLHNDSSFAFDLSSRRYVRTQPREAWQYSVTGRGVVSSYGQLSNIYVRVKLYFAEKIKLLVDSYINKTVAYTRLHVIRSDAHPSSCRHIPALGYESSWQVKGGVRIVCIPYLDKLP